MIHCTFVDILFKSVLKSRWIEKHVSKKYLEISTFLLLFTSVYVFEFYMKYIGKNGSVRILLSTVCICYVEDTWYSYSTGERSSIDWCRTGDLKLSTDFEHTIFQSSWFQDITDLMKNEFLYCSVLYGVVSSALELFSTE